MAVSAALQAWVTPPLLSHPRVLPIMRRRWSRHPNYFGEIVIWFGVWILALPEVSGWGHLILVGPLSVVFFLCFVSGVRCLRVLALPCSCSTAPLPN